ncbi:hypothetical protein MPLB_970003 [Mesorhizobium sp. ORS 3324]|nr:hypothetical protein MPLB_970003 [Mesorhizobium sp. ORS 3324]
MPAAGAPIAPALKVTGKIPRGSVTATGAFLADLSHRKNFARLPPPARLDSRNPPAYFSATLALALGEC